MSGELQLRTESEKKPRRLYTTGWIAGGLAVGGAGIFGIVQSPDIGGKVISAGFAGLGLITAGAIGGSYYMGDSDISPHRVHLPEAGVDDWEDPLAVEVGLGVGADDLPAEGWADTFDAETTQRVLDYLPEEEF